MKKILFVILCCLFLCGCSKGKEEENNSSIEKDNKVSNSTNIIKENELGLKYSYEQVNYYCFLHTYSNGKIISSQSFRFYFDESGNTTKIFFLATFSDGTSEKMWKEPDETCNTYQKVKSNYNTSSWMCGLFLNSE